MNRVIDSAQERLRPQGTYVHAVRRHQRLIDAMHKGVSHQELSDLADQLAIDINAGKEDPLAKQFLPGLGKDTNLWVTEGLNYVLNAGFNGLAQVSSWYLALFGNSGYTPAADDAAANIVSRSTEFTNYTEATRQAWTLNGASTAGQLTNSSSRATFTIDTGGGTVYGGFLASASAKSAGTGHLCSSSKFATSRTLVATDELVVGLTVDATDAGP